MSKNLLKSLKAHAGHAGRAGGRSRAGGRKAVISETILTAILVLIVGGAMFAVLIVQLNFFKGNDIAAEWAALGMRNNIMTLSTTESGYAKYRPLGISGFISKEFEITVTDKEVTAKSKVGQNTYTYPHLTENVQPTGATPITAQEFCVVKTVDADCKQKIEVCASKDACCSTSTIESRWNDCFSRGYIKARAPLREAVPPLPTLLAPSAGNGALYIVTAPASIALKINNVDAGFTSSPYVVNRPPGTYTLKFTKSGYQDFTITATVVEGLHTQVYGTLVSTSPDRARTSIDVRFTNDPEFDQAYCKSEDIKFEGFVRNVDTGRGIVFPQVPIGPTQQTTVKASLGRLPGKTLTIASDGKFTGTFTKATATAGDLKDAPTGIQTLNIIFDGVSISGLDYEAAQIVLPFELRVCL